MRQRRSKVNKAGNNKYDPTFAAKATLLIAETGEVNKTKIAGLLGVSVMTVWRWLRPSDANYQADFAGAIEKAQASLDCGLIKRSAIQRAQDGSEETVRELKVYGPQSPPTHWTKRALVLWSKEVLKLNLPMSLHKDEMEVKIRIAVEKARTEKLVVTKKIRRPPDTGTVELVLGNEAKMDAKWTPKQQVEHEAGATLADIAAIMTGKKR